MHAILPKGKYEKKMDFNFGGGGGGGGNAILPIFVALAKIYKE